jgi:hypothetical protein
VCGTRNARTLPLGPTPAVALACGRNRERCPLGQRNLFRPQSNQRTIEQLVIQSQSVRDLMGCDENCLRRRGPLVSQMLSILDERTVLQIEVCEAIRAWGVALCSPNCVGWA